MWDGRASLPYLMKLVSRQSLSECYEEIRKYEGNIDVAYRGRSFIGEEARLPDGCERIPNLSRIHPAAEFLQKRDCSHLQNHISICTSGQYSGRIILPVEHDGELVGFEAKSYSGHRRKALYPEWFAAGEYVYRTRVWNDAFPFAVVTESILDAECIGANAVGLFGCTLRDTQIPRLLELRKLGVEGLIWFLDDDAFRKQMRTIATKMDSLFENYYVRPPKGQDPCSLRRQGSHQLISQAKKFTTSLDCLEFEDEIRSSRCKPSCPPLPVCST